MLQGVLRCFADAHIHSSLKLYAFFVPSVAEARLLYADADQRMSTTTRSCLTQTRTSWWLTIALSGLCAPLLYVSSRSEAKRYTHARSWDPRGPGELEGIRWGSAGDPWGIRFLIWGFGLLGCFLAWVFM